MCASFGSAQPHRIMIHSLRPCGLVRLAAGLLLVSQLPSALRAQTALAEDYSKHTLQIASSAEPLTGVVRLARPDGVLEGEGTLKAGKLDGEWGAYTSDGKKLASLTFREGVRQGPVKIYFRAGPTEPLGRLRLEGSMAEGVFEGTATSWYGNGTKRTERKYAKGKLTSARAWQNDGTEGPADKALALAEADTKSDLALLETCERILREVVAKGQRIAAK